MPSITRGPQPNRRMSSDARERRRRQLRTQLLNAAESLLADGMSFTELSVERLAVAAGISRATFYVYFKDKSQLLKELTEEVFDEIAAAMQHLWQRAEAADAEDMRRATCGVIAIYRNHQGILTAVVEVASYVPEIDTAYRDLIERIATYSRDFLANGQAAGRIRPLDIAQTSRIIAWMVERSCQQMLRGTPPDADGHLADALTQFLWGAIYLEDSSANRNANGDEAVGSAGGG